MLHKISFNKIAIMMTVVASLIFCLNGYTNAQVDTVRVEIPDTTADPGQQIDIPVRITSPLPAAGALNEVISFRVKISWDTNFLEDTCLSVVGGSIISGWYLYANKQNSGWFVVEGAASSPILNQGDLLIMTFKVRDTVPPPSSTILHFEEMLFNEGDPEADPYDGSVTISGKKQKFSLCSGYNFISWSVSPTNDSVAVIFKDLIATEKVEIILDYYNICGSDEGWLYYLPPLGPYNPFQITTDGKGYFVKLNAGVDPDSLTVEGKLLDPQMELPLCPGYNSVAYLPEQPDSLYHALFGSINPDNVEIVLEYYNDCSGSEGWDYYLPPLGPYNPLQTMSPKRGYFIKLYPGMYDTLIYPEQQVPVASFNKGLKVLSAKPSVQNIRGNVMAIFLYGTAASIDGEPFAVGSLIEAQAGEHWCGRTQVKATGKYSMAIYGDDPFDKIKDGPEPGEMVTLYVNGQATTNQVKWTKFGDVVQLNQFTTASTDLQPMNENLPGSFRVAQNYPNPFNPETSVEYQLPENCQVVIKIYNQLGQEIKTLFNGFQQAGIHKVRWDGRDGNGNFVTSGIYLYTMKAGNHQKNLKMILFK